MSERLGLTLLVVVVGQVLYHVAIKTSPRDGSPFILIGVAYAFGAFAMLLAEALSQHAGGHGSATLTPGLAVRGLTVGLAVCLVEVGYLFAYRQGLSLAFGPLAVFTITSLVLIPTSAALGVRLTGGQALGGILIVAGLYLVLRQ